MLRASLGRQALLSLNLMVIVVLLLSTTCSGQGPVATTRDSAAATASVDPAVTSVQDSPAPTASLNMTSFLQSLSMANASRFASAPTRTNTAITPIATGADAQPSKPKFLDTRIDPTFGVLGGLLILSGLALTFYGSRNRWYVRSTASWASKPVSHFAASGALARTSFFLIGFWAAAMVIGLIILSTAVRTSNYAPASSTRGLYLLASIAGGALVGVTCIVWWTGAQHLSGAVGGFCVAMFLLALKSDGLISSAVGKYVLLVDASYLCTILFGSAALGATAFVLGVDCFTTGNLKEFYVYILGVGVPKRIRSFPHTTAIVVELVVMAALFLAGIAFQLKFYRLLVAQARALRQADNERAQKEDVDAARIGSRLTGAELEAWEAKHGQLNNTAQIGPTEKMDYLPQLDLGPKGLDNRIDGVTSNVTAPSVVPAAAPLSEGWVKYLSSRQIFTAKAGDNSGKKKPTARSRVPGRSPALANKQSSAMTRSSTTTNSESPATTSATHQSSSTPGSGSTPKSSSHDSFPTITTTSSSQPPAPARATVARPAAVRRTSRQAERARVRPIALGTTVQQSSPEYSSQDSIPLAQQMRRRYSSSPEQALVPLPPQRSLNAAKILDLDELEDRKRKAMTQMQARAGDPTYSVNVRPRRFSDSAEHAFERYDQARRNTGLDGGRRTSLGDQLDRFAAAQSGEQMVRRNSADMLSGGEGRRSSNIRRSHTAGYESAEHFMSDVRPYGSRDRRESRDQYGRRKNERASTQQPMRQSVTMPAMANGTRRNSSTILSTAAQQPAKPKKHGWLDY
ncbi:hypothetical protein OIO90_000368 [Microbotryomycetes sp. JL221]|nr:hypothetical protein OIO90_000368 [Microbotryomycetes sp. JL221]